MALELDGERAQGHVRGRCTDPAYLKDVVATADRMQPTAATFALLRLRVVRATWGGGAAPRSGVVLLGKATCPNGTPPSLADVRWVERSSRRGETRTRLVEHGGFELGVGGRGRGEFRRPTRSGSTYSSSWCRRRSVALLRPEGPRPARESLGHHAQSRSP